MEGAIVMNKKYFVRLAEEERRQLTEIVTKGKASAHKITHAHILLKADVSAEGSGWTDTHIAESFGVDTNTIYNIRKRFVEEGFEDSLNRKKRSNPGRQRILDGAGEAKLIAMSCHQAPAGRTRWTLHLLADKLVELKVVDSISHETVRQTLKKTS
jgi:transposase